MDITFGIITTKETSVFMKEIIDSIRQLSIKNYEIVVVGGDDIVGSDIIHLPFDEFVRDKWITKKKNLITSVAKYENIVYTHDYIRFDKNWYADLCDNFFVSSNIILNLDGSRFRDWCLNEQHNGLFYSIGMDVSSRKMIIPYDKNFSKFMYISGSYFIAKKCVMEEFPLNEQLVWGQGEDVEWSNRVLTKYKFSFNTSIVQLMKYKDIELGFLDENSTLKLEEYYAKIL